MSKFINTIKRFFLSQNEILLTSKENEWANIYNDSIRGKTFLKDLPLNIGRWAGNYTFFYLLNRILSDFKPQSILEFGVGESTKFITAYLLSELKDTTHIAIEQDEEWARVFINKNVLSKNSRILICPLYKDLVKGHITNFYQNLNSTVKSLYDFYIIDGPFGSNRFSRYDIVYLASNFPYNHEFIILIDDFNRAGEKETVVDLLKVLQVKGIKTYCSEYCGVKSVYLIGTEKFRYVTTL